MKKLLAIMVLGLLFSGNLLADENCKDLNPEIILDLGGSSDPEKIVYSTYDSCTKKHDYCGSMGWDMSYGIYGLFDLEKLGPSIVPLIFFENKNKALNYLSN